jgi:ComF family protein
VDRVIAIGPYAGTLRRLVRGLKYGGREALARPIGALLAERVRAARLFVDVVVPVPLDAARERKRGFNQAVLIARELAREAGLPLATGALRRARRTPALFRLAAAERAAAVAGAFAVADRASLAGKRVLLVDDILTTGATISACAEACRGAGATRVFAACAAREV